MSQEHPRPLRQRKSWESLDGPWDFFIDGKASYSLPQDVPWDRTITVPFSPETERSGVAETGFYSAVWYRRTFQTPQIGRNEHLLLHFEAVDYRATVWVNGAKVCEHEGGYTPFVADISNAVDPESESQEIVVRAEDDPADLAKPRGKQDWKLEPHSIWYPRTTGIWQTVWLEVVPQIRIDSLQWGSSLERWDIALGASIRCRPENKLYLFVRLTCADQLLAEDTYQVVAGEVHRRIALSDPGIDDFRNSILWSPLSPTLIDAEVELRNEAGNVIDALKSYTALRSVGVQGDKFILNGRPLILRLVLDQGYWPETGLTAPNDDALKQDVILAKRMGFNGVRKHQKIESARYLYWADRLGLLVWEEMPSAYRYTTKSIERLTHEWPDVVRRDCSHPCIIAWVPFNESWGVPDLPDSPAQRHYVQALYHLTKSLDPTRPVIGNDGWESIATDIIGIHDYDDHPERIGKRYGIDDIEAQLFKRERPGGRMLFVGGEAAWKHPIVLTEFGGIAFGKDDKEIWGYSRTETANELLERYSRLMDTVRNLPALAGFCYTQFTDTYQEANGLLYADRTPKAPFQEIALATTGSRPDHDSYTETLWREHIMQG
ncbi:MAG TPA: glycoside hydrolase family 2 TIM barrel-domain containing protein [Bryocella sp.]|nr:glycoside hydrolase family 2 TIM barrel-domain containing protein [Bryocella sp.]